MASALIHMTVSKKVNDYLKLPEQDYYLGSVAPDLAKYVGKTKKISHMIDNPEYKDLPNIYRFIEKYKTELNKPFEMGYLVHLLTDKIWYERFFDKFYFKDYVETLDGELIKTNDEELKYMVYSDYSSINMYLISKFDLDLSIFYNEIEIPETKIDELDFSKLPLMLNNLGLIFLKDKTKERYLFNEKMVNDFVLEATEEIIAFIKLMNLNK